jgi:hypothetical protein
MASGNVAEHLTACLDGLSPRALAHLGVTDPITAVTFSTIWGKEWRRSALTEAFPGYSIRIGHAMAWIYLERSGIGSLYTHACLTLSSFFLPHALFGLLMLLMTKGGGCYSFGEIHRWTELPGLGQIRRIDLPPPLSSSLVVATK